MMRPGRRSVAVTRDDLLMGIGKSHPRSGDPSVETPGESKFGRNLLIVLVVLGIIILGRC